MRTDGGLARWVAPGIGRESSAKHSLADSYAQVVPKFAGTELTIEINTRSLSAKASETCFRRSLRLSILRVA
jgi:hypothetical protein